MCLESLRTILALATIRDLDIIQFDIISAYLHGTLIEENSTKQPEGYVAPGKEDWVWRLEKGLYGLVQAGRTWNEDTNAHIESEGFTATPKDPTMYIKNSWTDRNFVAAGFWVDNYVAIGSMKELTALVGSVNAKYGMLLERDHPRKHDLDIPGGVHRLHSHSIQPHRCDHCRDASHPGNSPFRGRLSYLEGRN